MDFVIYRPSDVSTPLIFSQHYGIKKLTHVTNNVTNKILNTEKILSPQNT
jgi:hypothetical protein